MIIQQYKEVHDIFAMKVFYLLNLSMHNIKSLENCLAMKAFIRSIKSIYAEIYNI
jgi:hypothetical protein